MSYDSVIALIIEWLAEGIYIAPKITSERLDVLRGSGVN